jgi:hypothetical protein
MDYKIFLFLRYSCSDLLLKMIINPFKNYTEIQLICYYCCEESRPVIHFLYPRQGEK